MSACDCIRIAQIGVLAQGCGCETNRKQTGIGLRTSSADISAFNHSLLRDPRTNIPKPIRIRQIDAVMLPAQRSPRDAQGMLINSPSIPKFAATNALNSAAQAINYSEPVRVLGCTRLRVLQLSKKQAAQAQASWPSKTKSRLNRPPVMSRQSRLYSRDVRCRRDHTSALPQAARRGELLKRVLVYSRCAYGLLELQYLPPAVQ